MIRFGGVSVWRGEWGDPTRAVVAAVVTACLGGGFFKMIEVGRIGWPGDAFFADRIDDPMKFRIILAAVGVFGLAALAFLISATWDLVAAWRRNSGPQ